MAKLSALLLLLPLLSAPASAQKLRLSVDWAVFDADAQNVSIDLYYSFLQSDLNFVEADGKFTGTTLGQFTLRQDGKIVNDFAWKSETVIDDTLALEQQKNIVDRVTFIIAVGEYDCILRMTDLANPQNIDSTTWKLTATKPPANAHLSEIQLASTIRRAQQDENNSPFYKNSLIVEPNPSLIYSYEKPMLFFYLEAYNLPVAELSNGYFVTYYIQDADGNVVESVKPKTVTKKNVVNPSVEFGMLNVGELQTGSYAFVVEILDANNNTLAGKKKKFYTLQEDAFQRQAVVVQGLTFENSIFAALDSADVEVEYQMIFYILGKDEHIIYKQVTNLPGKRQFLYGFWQSKFPNVNPSENPHRNEYYNRKRIADERFNAFKIQGWITDRGRVFMVHGEPDEIDRYPMEADLYPYEIWKYYKLQGGIQFIFADLEGHKNYRLIHSDLDGEVSDLNYRETLRRGY